MSALTDLLLATTDPVIALMLVGLAWYIRNVKNSLHDDIENVRQRVQRVEGAYIPDGGEVEQPDD